MYVKTSFFDVMDEVKKDLEDISAGSRIFLNLAHKNFVGNLTSKSGRSALISPSTIRVNILFKLKSSSLLTFHKLLLNSQEAFENIK
jgi:hypothetical protein